jgi:predicted dehydrogenase
MKADDKIRAGIIGIGNWGRYGHVPVLQLLPKFEIVAVASRRQETAEQLAREFGIAHAFVDADELIHHPDVDLVIVLPPAPQHTRYVRAARLHQFIDLVSEASATGIKQTVDFWPAV